LIETFSSQEYASIKDHQQKENHKQGCNCKKKKKKRFAYKKKEHYRVVCEEGYLATHHSKNT
jgi:hypothetical protein